MRFAIVIRDKKVDSILNMFKSDSDIFITNAVGPETRQELKDIAAQIESQRNTQKLINKAERVNKRVEKNCEVAGI